MTFLKLDRGDGNATVKLLKTIYTLKMGGLHGV